MSETTDGATTTTIPTPNSMPGAHAADTAPADVDTTDGDEATEPTYEELAADRDKWRNQAKKNEARAKSNAEKAKQFDSEAPAWRAAFEREQAAANRQKTPEQIRAEADAEADRRIQEATAARAEAEAQLLRFQLADGRLPVWLMPLVTGKTEDEITEQIESVSTQLAEYVTAQLPDNSPRRPVPNPLAGMGGGSGNTPQDQFRAVMQKVL